MDLTTATPREIDEALAAIHAEIYKAQDRRDRHWAGVRDSVKSILGLRWNEDVTAQQVADTLTEVVEEGAGQGYKFTSLRESFQAYEDGCAEVDDLILSTQPYDEEFTRRGGWSRFFIVTSSNGHIHSSRACSTCRVTTQFGWLPSVSGKTEEDAVTEHGPLLCTVCFPSAPVEWTIGKKQDEDNCPGSGTWDYDRSTARTGYFSGNLGTCDHCGERVTLNKGSWKMRKHSKTA